VTPDPATIEGGQYEPLSRPLFIYVNAGSLERAEVAAFVRFYMEHAPALVTDVGYVPAPAEVYEHNISRIGPGATD
jgi:phosphate transport system substrate-binding protein